ncbi:MAG: 4Fe-4S binding protein [Candidatus Omnitrophica bacterium]|nr:4Fe-4S binding protein [Candidatus Omnitrophota bacterium]MBU1923285.1 4Fe-4S binding protein [Candidatus Omnitrophota bacterium]
MDKNKNYLALRKFCQKEGIDLFGVGDISKIRDEFKISPKVAQKLDYAICLGVMLSGAVLSEIDIVPTKLYFHHYKIVNSFLDHIALRLCNIIQKKGFLALAIPATQIIDWEKNIGHLSHRKLGVLSGLGWIGRNNLLVNEKFGSQFRLASILTNMPLKIDKPKNNTCNKCMLCVNMCPSRAIKESPADFDHLKCFEKLKSFQAQRQVEQFVCGICVNVCKGK